ncbi:MAG: hypothetical protein ACI4SO_07490 [Muribaculaceae bacterium]
MKKRLSSHLSLVQYLTGEIMESAEYNIYICWDFLKRSDYIYKWICGDSLAGDMYVCIHHHGAVIGDKDYVTLKCEGCSLVKVYKVTDATLGEYDVEVGNQIR